jgi:hypothetical protein
MIVPVPMGKLSKKLGIPVALLFLIVSFAIWFIPARAYYFISTSEWTRYGVNALVSLAGVLGCMGTIAWILFED